MADHKDKKKPRLAFRWLILIPLFLMWFLLSYVFISYSFSGLVCMCLFLIVLFYDLAAWLYPRYPKAVRVVRRVFTLLLCIGLLVVGITEAIIIRASFGNPGEECDYVVVLGCYVNERGPSQTLLDRINAAYDYLTAHPDSIAVVTGGQGPDEPMTEAQCMYNVLVDRGIDPDRVWMEGEATSTWENLKFSLDLIQEKAGQRPDRIGLLSSEFHLYRSGLQARAQGVEAVGIPAHTSKFSQMVNHFMREVAGVWHYILLGGQYSD